MRRDPIDSMFPLEHHFLRTAAGTPLRLFSELDMDNNNLMNSIEKARILHQQWGARAAVAAAVAGGQYPGGHGAGSPSDNQASLHHLIAAANSAAAASVQSLPQLFTLNQTRGSPSPLPIPAHLWSQWSALSQLPPGILGQSPHHPHHLQHQHQQQQQQHQHHQSPHSIPSSGISNSTTNSMSNNRGRSPINLRYAPYPTQMNAKAASTSPNPGSIPPSLINNESNGVAINSSRS